MLLGSFYQITFKLIDRGLIEIGGPLGITRLINKLTVTFSALHIGFIYSYIFIILFSATLLIAINFFYVIFSPVF